MLNLLPQDNAADVLELPNFKLELSSGHSSVQLQQSVSEVKHEKEDLTVFFGIGMTINIVMIVSFFIWAVKQWKKNDTTKK
ncbi:MAG: hypothetical protein OEY66_03420 [Gammaproteobacteria bacterium]|nr:hypothetical protein [Gammaproteobacteria bacterium]